MSSFRRLLRLCALLLTLLLGLIVGTSPTIAQAGAPTGRIQNTATLSFDDAASDSGIRTVPSNTVALDVNRGKRPTTLSFRLAPTNYTFTGAKCQTAPTYVFTPAPIDGTTFAAAPKVAALDVKEDMILVLDNQAGNHDSAVRETSVITADIGNSTVKLTLTETTPDSGIFAGGVPSTETGRYPDLEPCEVRTRGAKITLIFTEDEFSFGSTSSILIDPAGYTFDSRTGALVDGATVTLVDETGQPATVFGDDGVSRYPSSMVTGESVTDASGRVYPGETGRYRFPLTAPGRYALRVVPPGTYVAPSTVERATLAALKDPDGAAFILKGASFGETFTLSTPEPFSADIPLDAPGAGSLLLTKVASVREASPGDFVQYLLRITNRDSVAARGLHVADTLPRGLRYERNSARGGDEPSVSSDGRSLDFVIPVLAAGASTELKYVVSIAPGAPTGEALNRARVVGQGSVTSNEAAASVRLRPLLFTDAMTIIGRVTEGNCGDPVDKRKGVPGIRLLMEDGTFVSTDRDGLYHFEGVRAGRHVVQIDTSSIPATHAPVACDIDTRQANSPISRFVEGDGGLLKRVDFQLKPTGKAAAADSGLPITVADAALAAGSRDWLASEQTAGIDWLFPSADHNPRAPVVRAVVKHAAGQRVALTINGKQVEPLAFDGTDQRDGSDVAVSRWTGIPLIDGDNRLEARVLAADGSVVKTLDRKVYYAGPGVRAVFDAANSRLVADGLTRPLIAVRVTDKTGRPVRADTLVPFTVDQPYTAAVEAELEQGRQLAGRERASTTALVVGDDGLAFIALQPTTQAGAVHVVVSLAEEKIVHTSEVRAWLAASAKDWVVVGFGAGSLGYDMLSKRQSGLPRSERGSVVTDGQLAFYAKGRVKGSWLATIAYDSDHKYDPDRGLLGTIDPDRYYTVYGDGSRQGYDAATRRKLYLRLERREFYALFGDFETGFTDTQLTRYNRTLNGIKTAYEGKRVRATGFAAHTDTLYSRDEIQGNGLSGPYRLSGRKIVPNSDKLRLETRDRFRSELIVTSTELTRHIDYDIDTSMGTVRFRQPILSRDSSLNPIFIVADYEIEGGRSAKLAAAARVATKLANGRVEVGAAVIRDETVGKATVLGADIKARVDATTELRGEIAKGGRGGLGQGFAYLAEVDHHGTKLDLLAYARQQDTAFGVGQQNLVEAGTRKFGLDGRLRLTDRLSVTGVAWYQQQLSNPGTRAAGEARLEYRRDTGTIFVGGQFASDRGIDGKNRDSRLLTVGGTQALFGSAVTITGQTQFAPGGDSDSVDFPVRHQIQLAYRIKPGIRLIGGYEIANGDGYVAHTKQFGVDVAPWTGAKLMSTLNQQAIGENGARTYAQYGLSQSVPLGKNWTVDGTLDASNTLKGTIPEGAVVNAFQPVTSGGYVGQDQTNGDYAAATLGATYRQARWSWNGRLEYRNADSGDRWGITTNFLRTLGQGKTLASSIKAYTIKDNGGAVATYATADVALAFRPLDSRWSVLERLELRHESADAGFTDTNSLGVPAYGGGDQVTSRIINNLAVNYRTGPEGLGHGTEATLYYGAKYVAGRFVDDAYDGYIDVTGFEMRHDIGTRFDIGVSGSVQHAWERGAWSWSGGPSVGVSPAQNTWISAGYNVSGYRDRDFEDDRYTRQGPYVTMRLKFDQTTIGGATRALFGGRR
ncbi:hypothetical protein HMP09_2478 [Sphingomonas sp. HMP9]|uniref:DUF11 domain-containing protein n=1 Tax=Sphingomonas sp. HMP9 TaxID=1517554 RepID=UPI0015964AF1|nr:DUF11 domain-containing protein [Sphingomonas sp. HMP9]BCA63244.1 hypothetical protein HMP09_2478 [Sphingomonas sp. HMP9]